VKKEILLVGGSGFLGLNLIKSLENDENYRITSVSRTRPKNLKKNKNFNFIKADFSNFNQIKKSLKKKNFNFIINFGGNINHDNKSQIEKSHFRLCSNLVRFFRKKKINLFIQAGSSMEYGSTQSPNYENLKCKPKSYYGISKLKSTQLLKDSGLNYIVLRLYQIYGPHQKINRLIPIAINQLLRNKALNVSSGVQSRDFLYIDDFIKLIKKILLSKTPLKGIYNVGSGKPFTVKQVLEKIKKLIKSGNINFNVVKMKKSETKKSYPNVKKIEKIFKWKSKIKLDAGLKKTIKFYEKN
jgi:nucleoside-diphosphate-sugar epimerase